MEVRGEIEARDKLLQTARDLNGAPFMASMTEAALIVERSAKQNAPVDTGRLRGSIAHEVRTSSALGGGVNVQGVVGSNVKYAPYMELGTGTFVGRPRYFPPPSALEVWAKRHGTTAHAVAFAIWKRGGLKPRRYLQRAFEDNKARIVAILGRGVSGIVRK